MPPRSFSTWFCLRSPWVDSAVLHRRCRRAPSLGTLTTARRQLPQEQDPTPQHSTRAMQLERPSPLAAPAPAVQHRQRPATVDLPTGTATRASPSHLRARPQGEETRNSTAWLIVIPTAGRQNALLAGDCMCASPGSWVVLFDHFIFWRGNQTSHFSTEFPY